MRVVFIKTETYVTVAKIGIFRQEKKKNGGKQTHNLLINAWPKLCVRREPLLRHLHDNHFPFSFPFLKQGAQRQFRE